MTQYEKFSETMQTYSCLVGLNSYNDVYIQEPFIRYPEFESLVTFPFCWSVLCYCVIIICFNLVQLGLSDIKFALCSGGLELLCNSVKIHNVNVELQKSAEKVTGFLFICLFVFCIYVETEIIELCWFVFCVCTSLAWCNMISFCSSQLTMKDLLAWIRTNLIKERPEMFMKGDSV